MKPKVFALIDCNNFFVSCERLFRPDLHGKPVAVLSSNDGCAVARSNEVKDLGIPMGAPAFKYRDVIRAHNVITLSANFELYGDISRRVAALLIQSSPKIEIYSVDESFLDLSDVHITDHQQWADALAARIWREIGIPVSVGVARSKTLAKLATERAKKLTRAHGQGGAVSLIGLGKSARDAHLANLPVEDIWGIGRKLGPRMRAQGIATALDMAAVRPQLAQQWMGIHGRQLVSELNDISCHALEREETLPKTIARTRTFGQDTNDHRALEAALTSFVFEAAFRLRRSNQLTRKVSFFAETSRFKPFFTRQSKEITLPVPTADTSVINRAVVDAFGAVFRPDLLYHRAGVLLHDFIPEHALQTDLIGALNAPAHDAAQHRMQAIDRLNNRFGKRTIRYASEVLGTTWTPKQHNRSPRYVTNWNELPLVRIQKP